MGDDVPSFASRANRFLFRRRLGEGAFGVVWEVYDKKREAKVALKSLVRTDPAALLRFKREFRALADLVHPNLATLYELLSFDDVWFFTMEFVDGTDFVRHVTGRVDPWAMTEDEPAGATLRMDDTGSIVPTRLSEEPAAPSGAESQEVLHDKPTMTSDVTAAIASQIQRSVAGRGAPRKVAFEPDRIRAATRQLALGLSALHEARKLHRDIKPSNVLVTNEGRVVILDFGLITDLAPEGVTEGNRAVVGTPGFMSPEQALGKSLSPATDWYSVGAMLYVAMTGRMPFEGTPLQLLLRQQQLDPVPPSDFVSGIPEDLEQLCLDLLEREPSDRPTASEILGRLGGPDTVRLSIPPPSMRRTPFVGRRPYIAALREAYAFTERGRAAAVLIYGGSGVGKSTLVRRFLSELRVREPNAVILSGRCYEREAVPYKALDNLVDELSLHLRKLDAEDVAALMPRGVESLARLFPVLRQVEAVAYPQQLGAPIADPLELRMRAFGAMRDLFARLAGTRPVVLAIDDLQWGDADSDALLAELVRAPAPPLLLIATYRADEIYASPLRLAFSASADSDLVTKVQELHMTEFSLAEAEELATSLLGFQDLRRAKSIAEESGGNPLFIEALVQHLELTSEPHPQVPPPRDGDAEKVLPKTDAPPPGEPPSLPVPTLKTALPGALLARSFDPSAAPVISERLPPPPRLPGMGTIPRIDFADMIRTRVELIPEGARLLLETVIVAGRPIDLAIAMHAAGIKSFDPSMLAILIVSHLAKSRPRGGGAVQVEPYHDRVREHVLMQIPSERVKAHHAALAAAFEAGGDADPELLATHYEAGGQHDKAADYALKAAAEAERALAFDRAARLYETALRGTASPSRAHLIRLGEALVNAGRGARAADVFLDAARGVSGPALIDLRRRAAEQLLLSGHVERGLDLFRLVLDSLGMSLPASSRAAIASLLLRRAQIRLRGLRFEERDADAEELRRIDACWAVAIGLSLVDTFRGADFQARHLLLALNAGEPYRIARALTLEVPYSAAGGTRTQRRTERILRIASSLAERINNPHALGLTTMARGTAHFLVGEWKKAFEFASEGVVLFRERCIGVAWEIDTAEIFALTALMMLGRWNEMAERMEEDLRSAAARGDLYATTHINIVVGWCVEIAADAPEAARRRLDANFREESRTSFGTEHANHLYASANIHLYLGEAESAYALIKRHWSDLLRSFTLEIQVSLIDMLDLRARAAIGAAMAPDTGESRRRALLAAAERDIRRIEKERVPWGNAVAKLQRFNLARARGARAQARFYAIAAENALLECNMEVHAAVAQRRLGELAGGAEGQAFIDAADLRLAAHGIKNPEQIAKMFAPGG
jgi:serine/threonine protein kinase